MKLIVGLGNPGKQYVSDRHNAGFMALERLAERCGVQFSQKRARSYVATVELEGEHLVLAKPRTYMNLSGEAVRRLAQELRVQTRDLLVVYDDVDLPLGTLRLRQRGSGGTHNGMRSVIQALATQAIPRLRLGVGAPDQGQELRDYVLHPFRPSERPVAQEMVDRAAEVMLSFVRHGVAQTMDRYNR